MRLGIAVAMWAVVGCVVLNGNTARADAFEQNKKLGRGVNILGYDPIWRSRDAARFKADYFKMLKAEGFGCVRINLMPFRRMNPTNHLEVAQSWWKTVDWAVEQAQAQGLMVLLDLHEYTVMGKDPEGNRERFLVFWKQAAEHYRNASDGVLFEVLNEPSDKLTPELWNSYFRDALGIIRSNNPTRTVVVGPPSWNSLKHLDELELPESDTNLIVTIHYYEPFAFTHQGAAWAHREDKLGVEWLGAQEEQSALANDFDKAEAWSKKHQRPIFLGEFGAYEKGAMDSRARWTSAVARAAEQRGWSWAYWQFDSDFILYDVRREAWVEPIKKALIPTGSLKR